MTLTINISKQTISDYQAQPAKQLESSQNFQVACSQLNKMSLGNLGPVKARIQAPVLSSSLSPHHTTTDIDGNARANGRNP